MNEYQSDVLQTIAGATALCVCFYFLSTCLSTAEQQKQETERLLIERGLYEESPGRWVPRTDNTRPLNKRTTTEAGDTN